ncbi:hypothetical protein CHS0354_016174 [Potamilus streckersoni]|uniref:Mitotic spindle assembly checkpoint protein MAD2B n=1 Tax=Potamilus streckersoni TaxID=2493646 RepID=A0AAE0RX79_9BIVA|nr:hypothetical protein CHS0354_016174 [Potamilus streckersoni]
METEEIDKNKIAADIFAEFFEVALHCILYTRRLYPAGVFERRKKYNIPVQICFHPEVSQYVANVVDSVKQLMEQKEMEKVVVVVFNKQLQPVERYIFEVVSPGKKNSEDRFLYQLEQALRAFLLKLNVCDSLLSSLPEDNTWTVQVHTKNSAAERLHDYQIVQDFPWVLADSSETELPTPTLIPLKAVDSDLIKMQLYVEESGFKTGHS